MSHFGGNLLPVAVSAPAVAICLNSLLLRDSVVVAAVAAVAAFVLASPCKIPLIVITVKTFLYEYGAPLGEHSGHRSYAIKWTFSYTVRVEISVVQLNVSPIKSAFSSRRIVLVLFT